MQKRMKPKEFFIEYTRSEGKCRKCKRKLNRNEIRIAKLYQPRNRAYPLTQWYHLSCLFGLIRKYSIPENWFSIANFETIKYKDQLDVLRKMNYHFDENSPEEKQIKQQTDEQWNYIDKLKSLKKKELKAFLKLNGYFRSLVGKTEYLQKVAEFLTLGATNKCNKCRYGDLLRVNSYYQCQYFLTDHLRCMNTVIEPDRKLCKVPKSLFGTYVPKIQNRVLRANSECLISAYISNFTESNGSGVTPPKIRKLFYKNHAINDSTGSKELGFSYDRTHVYKSKENVTYSCNLNKVDQQKELNSFYSMRILADDCGNKFRVVREYGVIGFRGEQTENSFKFVAKAIELFKKLFNEKTGNIWADEFCKNFIKKKGKYVLVDNDYQEKEAKRKLEKYLNFTELDEHVQNLIKMIFNIEIMNQTLMEFQIDANRFPLGRISDETMVEAEEILMKILKLITKGALSSDSEFINFTNMFYEKIPHIRGSDSLINDLKILEQKVLMLGDIKNFNVVYKLCNNGQNPVNKNYESLQTEIKTLNPNLDEFIRINRYATETFVASNTDFKIEIKNIFMIKKAYESDRFQAYNNFSNRRLVFHGTKLCNVTGILKNGLKINPLNVVRNGKVFGNGVYFTDVFSQACVYSKRPDHIKQGLIVVCEVALGEMHEVSYCLDDKFEENNLPPNKDSLKAIGKFCPSNYEELSDGTIIPRGPVKGDFDRRCEALHNEFVVFREDQFKMRYLIEVNFI